MFPLEAIVPRACTSMARGLELEIWEQNYCLAIVYQLPVKLRTLCQWPMKWRAQTEFPRGFPVPLDKGNEGSGDEIGYLWLSPVISRQRLVSGFSKKGQYGG